MGYEVRLHIGQEWFHDSSMEGRFPHSIREIATIDLSNPGSSQIASLVAKYQQAKQAELDAISTSKQSSRRRNASTMLYTDVMRGNREVHLYQDNYGMPLVVIPIQEVRDALAADWEASKAQYTGWDKGYRRFYVALALIDSIIETFTEKTDYIDEETKKINPLAGQLVAIPWGH